MVALAAILDGLMQYHEAESLYLEALPLLERAPEPNAHEIGVALNDLGAHYARRGTFDRATELLVRAVELKVRTLGAHHPDVAVSLNNLGFVLEQQGDQARAAELCARAVRLNEVALGPEHPGPATAGATTIVRHGTPTLRDVESVAFDQRRTSRRRWGQPALGW
jgi:tetratricopeptide (TPR) repeat protein